MLDAVNTKNLFYAIFLNDKETVLVCLEEASQDKEKLLNTPDKNGITPLRLAVLMYRKHIVPLLIAHGANFEERDHNGNNFLHTANYLGYQTILKIFLEKNVEDLLCQQNSFGWTPFQIAVMLGNESCLKQIKNKATVSNFLYVLSVNSIYQGMGEKIKKSIALMRRILRLYADCESSKASRQSNNLFSDKKIVFDACHYTVDKNIYASILTKMTSIRGKATFLEEYTHFQYLLDGVDYYFNNLAPSKADLSRSKVSELLPDYYTKEVKEQILNNIFEETNPSNLRPS